jgi:hypothetical protein
MGMSRRLAPTMPGGIQAGTGHEDRAMSGKTVSANLNEDLASRLRETASVEDRSGSQVLDSALTMFLDIAPSARQSIYALHGSASGDERAFLARFVSRQVLRAHHAIIESRYLAGNREAPPGGGANAAPETEEDLENEAARLCRTA